MWSYNMNVLRYVFYVLAFRGNRPHVHVHVMMLVLRVRLSLSSLRCAVWSVCSGFKNLDGFNVSLSHSWAKDSAC
jgi:hypothetical protein